MSDEEMIEQTIKTRYVIQHRTLFIGCEYGIHRFWHDCKAVDCKQVPMWSSWEDGAGYKPGENGPCKFLFSEKEHVLGETTKALKLARRRRHVCPTEYRLVRQESIWTTVE